MTRQPCFTANRAPSSGRGDDAQAAEDADDPNALSAYRKSATASPRPSRIAMRVLFIAVASIAALLTVHVPATLSAQDAETPADAATAGELVVVPSEVQKGQTTLAVGFHVVPFDLQVTIQYSEHFTPEGDSCDNAGTAGATQPAAAPTWITLNACTVGDGYVRLVESANGNVIKNVSVSVIEPVITAQQGAPSVSISGLTTSDLVPEGSGDRFSVSASGLESHREHNLHTVVLNERSAAFNSGCTRFKESDSIVGQSSATARYTVYGCIAPGDYLWSYVEVVSGITLVGTGPMDNPVNVADPKVSFSAPMYSVKEGSKIDVPVKLTHGSSDSITTRIIVSPGTNGSVTFAKYTISKNFPYTAPEDSDCEDEKVTLRFGTLPSTVSGTGSHSSATVTIKDDDPCASFGSSSYTVDEGDRVSVAVKLTNAPGRSVTIPVTVSPGPDARVSFTSTSTTRTLRYTAPQDSDCEDETVNLRFGTLPSGVSGTVSPSRATITIRDDDLCVSFGSSTYTVNEGDSVTVDVELNEAPGRTLTIPVIVSPGPDETVTFRSRSDDEDFDYTAPQDRDSDDETVNLRFGTLPTGVVKGTPSTATINIQDDDPPNADPVFDEGTRTTRSVAENTAPNTNIGSPVSATDDDNDALTYSLSGTDAGSFAFDSSDGQIKTSTPLNFESKNSYSVTVDVDDGNDGTDSIRVTMNVTDVAERPGKPSAPTVTANGETSLNVTWSAPSNTGPTINDYDVRYRVDGSSGSFTSVVHRGTDRQTTISNLSPETVYEVQVRAKNPEGTSIWSDSGTGSTDAPALPAITIARDDASVTEGEDVGFTLTASRASAAALTVEVSVSETGSFITGTTPTEATFAGGETTAQLTVETVNDDVDEANGTIKATVDSGTGYTVGNPSSATVTVEDDDEPNVPPTFDEGMDTTRSVAENTASNTDIGNAVTATDADMDTLTYSLSGTDAGSFTIVGTSSQTETGGQIQTSDPLNFESKNSYSVTVNADDANGGTDSIRVTINVTNVNEAPVGKTIADRTLASGVLSREIDLSPYFSDPDGDTLSYSAVSSPTGIVTLSVDDSMLTLERVSAGSTTITVTAADRASGDADRMTASQAFTVTVVAPLPTVTIEASTQSVGEGQLVPFILSANPAPTTALKVKVSVTETGSFLTGATPTQVTIALGSNTASLTLQTTNDMIDEANGTVTATVLTGAGYSVGSSSSASVTVRDDDLSRPPKLEGVSASSTSSDSANVRWSHRTGIEEYKVQYREGDKPGWRWVYVNVSSPDSVTDRTTIISLKCETRYRFRVRAWGDGVGYLATWGQYSDVVYATTGRCVPVTVPPPTTPTPDPDSERYAPLLEPPSTAYLCRGLPWLPQVRKKHPGTMLTSADGRQEAHVELYSTRQVVDLNSHCVEARFVSQSTPGADRISWGGELHKTERFLNLEGLNPGEIGLLDRFRLLRRYEDQPLTADTPAFRTISRSCKTCRGGTIQTEHDFVEARLLKVPTIYAIGKHKFNAGGVSVAMTSRAEWTVPRMAFKCEIGIDCVIQQHGTIEEELSEDVDTGLLGDLISLIAGIAEFLDDFDQE